MRATQTPFLGGHQHQVVVKKGNYSDGVLARKKMCMGVLHTPMHIFFRETSLGLSSYEKSFQ